MSSKQQHVKLNDGHFIPALGFGTYKPEEVPENKPLEAINLAIEAGFRHIDTAYVYQTEKDVGQAIRSKIAAGIVKREDIFVVTKLWCTFFRPELVRSNLEKSLKNLQLDYVDLYIIHYPVPMKPGENLFPEDEHGKTLLDTVDICATWEAMEKCKDAGLVKSIGVSNFNSRQLEKILNKPGLKYKPVCNQPTIWKKRQNCTSLSLPLSSLLPKKFVSTLKSSVHVECHLYLNQSKLLNYCKSKNIVLVAYCALGSQRPKRWVDPNSPVLLNDPVLCDMAKKHKRSPAQIALRYHLQRGIVVLAQSYKENEIKENLQVLEFELPLEDMKILDSLNRNLRYAPAPFGEGHPEYPFSDEF
ncbi:aldo-keto reductase family 1 member C13-like isoform X1 [Peromyscus eremicus]|uniref:aldo-keto reductase family 1 member C13-like isoform X1 n=1 Tax=Peromyscus eremicus TaxID=42410 RepID=UPI0027DD6969|nr:aldo-keto reductase family 1 member C13-like isoform X1 [Peromyscus eremicus]XP_059119432.1 aldo-keto reductase family 1 member C13-like isoform X1 [Peromyscus eremicus]XP_059119433.1 aldo-keto reductase family 1 member C13-like isoform X1 [Peromyscus eremicus]XP_059119435.1 aldo-keto reductase family 1 member C13-like isoform X1 [Peromyscus eremicus]XP_059119436.1 aldo-keto reductase family 1 member C13-like isoform X1 [Peromyscus eremicus]XP_059119437.1 aldo-keto reductase family 1 member